MMASRFQQLRQAVANLAAPAEEQVRYLDHLFASITGGGSAEAYGNDELVEEFDDIFLAANDMIEYGELTEAEKEAVGSLEATLTRWCGQRDAEFWLRDALFSDPRWTDIRACAAQALAELPDEERAFGRFH
jgi:hypothetical protein